MRDYLLVYINGVRHTVSGADCWLTVSDFLRRRLGLVGTKIVCSEGDCGSCTVLGGYPVGDRLQYRSIDSCIALMFQLDGKHLITIEGLSDSIHLTPVQQAMVDCHASQCGFCTPGFVMSMTGLREAHEREGDCDWRAGLSGNLCRCTGYVALFESARQAETAKTEGLHERFPPIDMLRDFAEASKAAIDIEAEVFGQSGRLFSPTNIQQAVAFLERNPNAKVVAGATDVGVQINKGVIQPAVILDLNGVTELESAQFDRNSEGTTLVVGARANWAEIERLCREEIPELARIVSIFGSPQIRHLGTVGGNIINASPIADSLPFLLVMEAELELQSVRGKRTVPITDFYRDYKKFDLQAGELLSFIHIPVPSATQLLRLYKVSRRRDLDISTFTAAILMSVEVDQITDARVALGGVGPTVIRARTTEEFLIGRTLSISTMQAAGDVAVREIAPIGDVRGSADYRNQLTRNVLLKFFHEFNAPAELVPAHV